MPDDDAHETGAPARSGRLGSWLLARRPARAEHPAAGSDAGGSAGAVEAEPEGAGGAGSGPVVPSDPPARRPRPTRDPLAQPEPAEPAEPTEASAPTDVAGEPQQAASAAAAGSNPADATDSRPEDETERPGQSTEDEPGPPPESAIAAASAGRRHRPRPSASAPLIYEDADEPAEPKPGEGFFTRADDDEPAAKRSTKPEKQQKPAKEQKPEKKRTGLPSWVRRLRSLVVIAVIAVAAALALRAYVVAPYYVPSASMEPTLHGCPGCNDDRVMVEKLSYDFHDPRRGDVVVFDRPSTWQVQDKVLIKRVVGVAGDRITIKNGHVFISGSMLDEPYVNQKCRPQTTADPGSSDTRAKTFRTVPNGDLFVMGDNRCDSEDSRVFGVVPVKNVIGRAFLIVWPLGRLHSL